MKIVKLKYNDSTEQFIQATMDDNSVATIPVESSGWYNDLLNEALESGMKVEPFQTEEEKSEIMAQDARARRNELLNETDWLVLRHLRETALGRDSTLTEEQYNELEVYRQELTDLPEQKGFPDQFAWPKTPSFVTSL